MTIYGARNSRPGQPQTSYNPPDAPQPLSSNYRSTTNEQSLTTQSIDNQDHGMDILNVDTNTMDNETNE
jgi:hypothetical protein